MKYIIPIFVGAVIGYITNWLAIKMLFRPHEEKRILGFHIPFTPGLIPKERSRIAKSVGETVGSYLLSPEVIMNSITSNKIDGYLKEWIQSNINKLKKDNRSLTIFIINLINEKYDTTLKKVKNQIVEFICMEMRKESFKHGVMAFIKDHIFHSSMKDLHGFLDERLELLLSELFTSNETKNLLKNIIQRKLDQLAHDERKLNEVIPEDFIYAIKYFIRENDEEIIHILNEILGDSQVEIKIKKTITNLISQNINKLIAMFISPEIISDKVYTLIKEYLDKPQVKDNVVDILITVIDRSLDNRVDNVFNKIKSNIGEEDILNIANSVLAYISNETNQEKVINIIGEKIKSQEQEIQNDIFDLLSRKLDEVLTSESLYNNIYTIVDEFIEKILDKPISSMVENIDETIIADISNLSMNMLNYFIENKLPYIVELFDISKVVEDQINSYDVAFTEELILEIAHRELKAITWLGALLGGIMGILTPLLQMI